MALPHGLTEQQVRDACAWGFWKRLQARRQAVAGDAQAAILLMAHATAKSLRRALGAGPSVAIDDTVRLLARCSIRVEVARG